MFFNPLFYICHPILFLYFFPISVFWIPVFQRGPKILFLKNFVVIVSGAMKFFHFLLVPKGP
jgi:hypothetical protein